VCGASPRSLNAVLGHCPKTRIQSLYLVLQRYRLSWLQAISYYTMSLSGLRNLSYLSSRIGNRVQCKRAHDKYFELKWCVKIKTRMGVFRTTGHLLQPCSLPASPVLTPTPVTCHAVCKLPAHPGALRLCSDSTSVRLRPCANKHTSHVVTNIQLPIVDTWYTDGLFWRFYCHWSHLKFTVCHTQGLVLMFLSTSAIQSTIHYSNEHHILMLNCMKKGQFVT
jgi:hypothetical protein